MGSQRCGEGNLPHHHIVVVVWRSVQLTREVGMVCYFMFLLLFSFTI